MTREYVLLIVAGALIALGLILIVTAVRRARRREEARQRVDALLTLVSEPPVHAIEMDREQPWDHAFREELLPQPAPVAARTAPLHPAAAARPSRRGMAPQFVVTLSDSTGSFSIRPRAEQ